MKSSIGLILWAVAACSDSNPHDETTAFAAADRRALELAENSANARLSSKQRDALLTLCALERVPIPIGGGAPTTTETERVERLERVPSWLKHRVMALSRLEVIEILDRGELTRRVLDEAADGAVSASQLHLIHLDMGPRCKGHIE